MQWRGLVAEQMASRQSVAAFCRERGLRDWQFYEWKNRLRQAEAGQFVAVENYRVPYITVTPSFSICPKHGYLEGEHIYCPKCDADLIARKRLATQQ